MAATITTPVQPLTVVEAGDEVTYRGSLPDHHGRPFTVTAVRYAPGSGRKFDLAPLDGGKPLFGVSWSSLDLITA